MKSEYTDTQILDALAKAGIRDEPYSLHIYEKCTTLEFHGGGNGPTVAPAAWLIRLLCYLEEKNEL